MKRFCVLSAAILAALSASLRAEDITEQPTVQVTASRVAQSVDDTLADVSVITRQDIDASASRDVYDLLRLQAGVDIYRTGGAGGQTALFLRGTNANQVLVLIDGVRASSATTGGFTFGQLPLDAIERIEIVRGPRASYWGADAIGGVIQIFTRRIDGSRIAVGYGSYGDADGSAGIGHWNGADGYSVQVGARHVRGFSATNPSICNGPDDPYCSYNPDDDGYRNTNAVVRAAHTFGSQVLSGSLYRSQGQSQFDQGYVNTIMQVGGVNLDGALADNWTHHLGAGFTREDSTTPAFGSSYLSRRWNLTWQNEFRLDEHQQLVAGVDYTHEKGQSLDLYAGTARVDDARHDTGVFAGWRTNFGAFDSELSGRYDDSSAYGSAKTGSLALGWRVSDAWRVYASFGQGFRAPTMNELYDPGYGGWYAGNPDLTPERSHSSELGLEFTPVANQHLKANLYSTRVNDLISFTGFQSQAINIAHAAIDGAQLSYDAKLGDWTTTASYTWEDPRDADAHTQLLRRARNKASAIIERAFGPRFTAGAEVNYVGHREDVGDVRLGGYALLNLRARYAINDAWSIDGRIENIADRNYVVVHGYNVAGRSLFAQVVWQPGH